MSEFIVSALKYRPQNFDTVVGQEHITTTLKNAIKNDHLAHSFLFCGPRGVGKTSTARIMAKVINCENLSQDAVPCDECASCKAFNEHASYNIYELDAASNNSVDDIRTLIEGVRFAPQRGQYKVYIIDEVHMLSNQAFNAFLKTLEEPPSHAIFILATTEKHKIIPTILSRCQIFDFKRITVEDNVEHLKEICSKENISYEEDALQVIAQKSEGCMRDSLSLMDKLVSFNQGKLEYDDVIANLNILDYDYFFQLGDYFQQNDTANMLLMVDDILKKGFEESILVEGLLQHYRNLLVSKNPESKELLECIESVKDRYIEVASKTSIDFILTAMQILNDTSLSIKNASNKRLLTETQMLKLAHLSQLVQVTEEGTLAKKTEAYIIPRPRKIKSSKEPQISKKSSLKIDSEIPNKKLETAEPEPSAEPVAAITASPKKEVKSKKKKASTPAISLVDIVSQKNEARKTNALDEAEKNKVELNQNNINDCWTAFKEQLDEDKDGLTFRMLDLNTLHEKSETSILVRCQGKSAMSTFQGKEMNMKILDFFRNQLSQPIITFEYELLESQNDDDRPILKNKYELLEEFKAKNPKLAELQKKIGLELY